MPVLHRSTITHTHAHTVQLWCMCTVCNGLEVMQWSLSDTRWRTHQNTVNLCAWDCWQTRSGINPTKRQMALSCVTRNTILTGQATDIIKIQFEPTFSWWFYYDILQVLVTWNHIRANIYLERCVTSKPESTKYYLEEEQIWESFRTNTRLKKCKI